MILELMMDHWWWHWQCSFDQPTISTAAVFSKNFVLSDLAFIPTQQLGVNDGAVDDFNVNTHSTGPFHQQRFSQGSSNSSFSQTLPPSQQIRVKGNTTILVITSILLLRLMNSSSFFEDLLTLRFLKHHHHIKQLWFEVVVITCNYLLLIKNHHTVLLKKRGTRKYAM